VVLPRNFEGNRHSMKKLFLLSLPLLSLSLSLSLFSAEIKGKVIGISDGDTITILDDLDKGTFRIRLDKIDAPEKGQAFGDKAKQHLSSLVFGRQVSVRFKGIDRYGRISGIIYLDDTEINLAMVQSGYAWHYSYYDKTPAYIEAEKQARTEKKGLWENPDPINPYQFRKHKKSSPML
jgi:endonuclease YncB( thermonuclease family)